MLTFKRCKHLYGYMSCFKRLQANVEFGIIFDEIRIEYCDISLL
ncbi:hypothetical protein SAMN05444350_1319 [Bacteroides stercorirosoris]|uniref:Uncharacterized protein n=1 Tax=Bacteroides stercorirosoris TaxID=871324 RepID=A0A1M6JPK0_9BACE|nr:hypothetical protein SAMN05444350_1319 [Bacteroides stercorirosoris]